MGDKVDLHGHARLKILPFARTKSIGIRDVLLAHPDLKVFTLPALLNDFSAVMDNNALDFLELVRFDYEFKRFARRQKSET